MSKQLLSWNRYPRFCAAQIHAISNRLAHLPSTESSMLAYGNGRSYGDVCLNQDGCLLMTRYLDRFINFDPDSGILRCESGVTLEEILSIIVPKGWFLPSTPGTRYVTIGGALANDVHGKNHHSVGTFGHHVRSFELLRSDGQRLECTPSKNSEYFHATIGGLGLTGLVTWVEIQLMPIHSPWMYVESKRFHSLKEFWPINHQYETEWPYTVAWIDCLAKNKQRGRGIFFSARHASMKDDYLFFKEGSWRIPVTPPISLVNNLSVRVFNKIYYWNPSRPNSKLTHYIPYFYPLDKIKNWNRIYGRKGFLQYQCVLPHESAETAIDSLLEIISKNGQGSFLAVLKTFGNRASLGMLSFARPGVTLALDFPNQGERTLRLLDSLDFVVKEAGGALYPAKDSRMSGEMFQCGFPEWESFMKFIDPKFSSSFWRRVTQ